MCTQRQELAHRIEDLTLDLKNAASKEFSDVEVETDVVCKVETSIAENIKSLLAEYNLYDDLIDEEILKKISFKLEKYNGTIETILDEECNVNWGNGNDSKSKYSFYSNSIQNMLGNVKEIVKLKDPGKKEYKVFTDLYLPIIHSIYFIVFENWQLILVFGSSD